MGDTFERIAENKDVYATKGKLELLADYAFLLKDDDNAEQGKIFLYVVQPDEDEESDISTWQGSIHRMQQLTKKQINAAETKIVKKVIQEDENGFTFGDKVRNKIGSFFGLEDETRTFKMIGEELYKKVKNGDYEIIKTVSNPETQKYPRIFEIRVKIFNTPCKRYQRQ